MRETRGFSQRSLRILRALREMLLRALNLGDELRVQQPAEHTARLSGETVYVDPAETALLHVDLDRRRPEQIRIDRAQQRLVAYQHELRAGFVDPDLLPHRFGRRLRGERAG